MRGSSWPLGKPVDSAVSSSFTGLLVFEPRLSIHIREKKHHILSGLKSRGIEIFIELRMNYSSGTFAPAHGLGISATEAFSSCSVTLLPFLYPEILALYPVHVTVGI